MYIPSFSNTIVVDTPFGGIYICAVRALEWIVWLVCNSHNCCQKNGEHTPVLCHNDAVATKTSLSLPAYMGKLSLFIHVNIFFDFTH